MTHDPDQLELIDAPFLQVGFVEAASMDRWLDHLQVLFTTIRQRRMTADQLDRYALLLGQGQADALARVKKPRRARRAA